jgi:hypothetical protein
MQQGRPQLFARSRQISVLVSADEYQALDHLVQKQRVGRPGYTFGDLLRSFIRESLQKEDTQPLPKLPPAKDRIRRLHAIARSAVSLAHELEKR